ncbi:MAG TPA: sigma-70 family RNA polymerase sigma factor [Pyrinomonadaceae bacterium]|nr:sigma-70 family RNA polymerase sigma factor [Pyrinomonadaceae bacterium]
MNLPFLKAGEFVKPPVQEITQCLVDWGNGDRAALDRLIPMVYEELHRLSRHYMREERRRARGLVTLQSKVLINEVYLRLIDARNVQWQNRAHFFAMAAHIMRRILVDYARTRSYLKRGGAAQHVTLEEASVLSRERPPDLVALDDALSALAQIDERKARVVELRFFGGLNVEETAEVLKVSPVTVMRDWRLAKSWLFNELERKEK